MGEARKQEYEQDTYNTMEDNRWKHILLLGERLLSCHLNLSPGEKACSWDQIILEQGEITVSTAAQLFAAQAALWLSPSFQLNQQFQSESDSEGRNTLDIEGEADKSSGTLRTKLDLYSPKPASELMRAAFESGQVSCLSRENALDEEHARIEITIGFPEDDDVTSLAVPVMVHAQDEAQEPLVVAVLCLERTEGQAFSGTDLQLIRGMAVQVRIGFSNSFQMALEEQRLAQYATLVEVSNAIASVLDTEQLLDQVVELVHKRFGYPYVHLFRVNPGRGMIFYEAGSGARSRSMRQSRFSIPLDDKPGIIPWVARNGETVFSNDISQEPRYRPEPFPPRETCSELTVPLKFGDKVLGVLDVQSDKPDAFNQQDRFLLEGLADNVAVALRNSYLYRSEQWRRQVADSLREVAGLLSAEASLDHVLDAALVELERNLPCDLATIWLIDENISEEEDGSEFPPLRLAAAHGVGELIVDLEIGVSLDEVITSDSNSPQVLADLKQASWLIEAFESEEPVIRTPESSDDPGAMPIVFSGSYSAIAAPLRVGTQNLGVLTLFHHTVGRYGKEAQAMTSAFASYAAVAIENTRLYEAAHEQAWISTVMLQVADATQTLTDLRDLVETVVNITPTVAGVGACMLYLLEEENVFVPTAAAGLNQAQQYEFERWRFSSLDVPAFDRILTDKQPTILDEATDDWRLASVLYVALDAEDIFADEYYILVPLLAHDEVLGAVLITYQVNLLDREKQRTLDTFFDEKLPIIQGIAHQTAVSIENTRLIRAQREEAYVSVALLQVAQAIVSMTNLDDILETIVRITPILVGVKRAVIYLYDARSALYQLVQAYGLPQDVEGCFFVHEEFPVLDAAREGSSLVVLPAVEEWDESEDIHDAWTCLPIPEQEEVEGMIAGESPLIIAFPLSVQEELLGILLVEEPETSPLDIYSGERSYRRLREKRLEIITGISQQASLAIQNARLQQEVVDRERLERELQLAREIQQSFLPVEIPEFPGWEISVRWQPAREVGGDFYDCFELPGNRFGIVIADVADKGMPAALYMTLVSTVIRAAIQDVESPSEVLSRVNDVLVVNSEGGMFVTLFYAVFSTESNEIVYANAGHAPPILLRSETGEMEPLIRGGMALGVLDETQIEERSINVEVGDYLVLYTDGVTEAISAQGDLFEDQRLFDVLTETVADVSLDQGSEGDKPTTQVIDAIDAAVSEFMGDGQRSDDMTLVVVKNLAL